MGSKVAAKTVAATEVRAERLDRRVFTIPNILCFLRLGGALVLLPIAWQQHSQLFLWLYIFLALTDWVDGKLAIILDQRSVLGARLDSWADAALQAALVFGMLVMFRATLRPEWPLIVVALLSYGISTAAGLLKYRRWPSYHTRAAKITWFLTLVAVISLFNAWSLIPLRVAATAIILTNLEALAITAIAPRWRVDVASVYHAWKRRPRD